MKLFVFMAAFAATLLGVGHIAADSTAGGAAGYPMKLSKQKITAIMATFQDGEGAWIESIHATTPNDYLVDLRTLTGRCSRVRYLFPKNSMKPLVDGNSHACE